LRESDTILKPQKIWESLNLPKSYCIEKQLSYDPVILFIQTGSLRFRMNGEEAHTVFSQEMFMAQSDNLYEITILEQTHLIICYVPLETWCTEQKWIKEVIPYDRECTVKFFKLPIKKMVSLYLSLIDHYLKDGIRIPNFFELKRQELFFLLFYYYQRDELAQFLQCILSNDIHFKKFVVSNYLNARNVKELAKLANYSTSGFIKKFQKCFNDSPYKWMQKQKAKQISIDIYQGIKSLQEIANEYNFSSYQHFAVFCKTQLGGSPSAIFEKSEENYRWIS